MLNSITFAGFNIVDLEYLYLKLKKPIIVIINNKPNNRAILQALKKHFPDWKMRWDIIKKSGFIHTLTINKRYKPIYFEVKGIDYKIVRNLIQSMTILGRYPEPIRVIRMIAKQLTTK
jgi:endonuclease V-like protein UPF0215 family